MLKQSYRPGGSKLNIVARTYDCEAGYAWYLVLAAMAAGGLYFFDSFFGRTVWRAWTGS